MIDDPPVKNDDWIELDVVFGCCRWARVRVVYTPQEVSVVCLQGNTPVEDEMILGEKQWRFKTNGPSGRAISGAGEKRLVEMLQVGPPSKTVLEGDQYRAVFEQTPNAVWLRARKF